MFSRLVNIMWAHGTLELLAVHSYCPNGQELKRAAAKFKICHFLGIGLVFIKDKNMAACEYRVCHVVR